MSPIEMTPAMLRCMHREPALKQPSAAPIRPAVTGPHANYADIPVEECDPHRHFTIPGEPIGKPRMTQRDKWAKRPCVLRYREWADKARAAAGGLGDPTEVSWTAYFQMPKSWSKMKRAEMKGTPHRQKPDRDNVDKAVLDALFKQDCGVAIGFLRKFWDDGNGPRLEVSIL